MRKAKYYVLILPLFYFLVHCFSALPLLSNSAFRGEQYAFNQSYTQKINEIPSYSDYSFDMFWEEVEEVEQDDNDDKKPSITDTYCSNLGAQGIWLVAHWQTQKRLRQITAIAASALTVCKTPLFIVYHQIKVPLL